MGLKGFILGFNNMFNSGQIKSDQNGIERKTMSDEKTRELR